MNFHILPGVPKPAFIVADPPDFAGRFRGRNRKNKHRIPELNVGGSRVHTNTYIYTYVYVCMFLWGRVHLAVAHRNA